VRGDKTSRWTKVQLQVALIVRIKCAAFFILFSIQGEIAMTSSIRTIIAIAASSVLVTTAFAQTAREVRGPTPYFTVENEPAPKLIVDSALPGPLAVGLVQIQYRVENVRILPVFGEAALKVSPRVGHLHITVDDLPWWWADASDLNTVDIAGMPAGPHKVKIELVDANHKAFPGQMATVTFTIPEQAKMSHK
jgi:Family of unknown function (DUF6130)